MGKKVLDNLRNGVATAKATLRELEVLAVKSLEDNRDPDGKFHARKIAGEIREQLERFGLYLELATDQDEEFNQLTETRGLNNLPMQKLLQRRDRASRFLAQVEEQIALRQRLKPATLYEMRLAEKG